MKTDPKRFIVPGAATLFVLVLLGALFFFGAFGLRSITANTHTYQAFNQTWTATPVQAWGTLPTNCALGGRHNGLASYVTSEENTSSLLHFTLTTPNSYGNICDFNTGIDLTLETVDLRNYSAGRIHRSLSMSMYNGNRATYTADVNGLLTDQNPTTTDAFNQAYGDITWTNDGNTITLKSDEYPNGKLITIGNNPVRLHTSDLIATNPSGSSNGRIEVFITGIDLVPMPASVKTAPTTIPVPVSVQPVPSAGGGAGTVTTLPGVDVPIPVAAQAPSWWQGFLTIVQGAWTQFRGWFGGGA